MEDGWILARALQYSSGSIDPISKALAIFEEIRVPYCVRMYVFLSTHGNLLRFSALVNPWRRYAYLDESGASLKEAAKVHQEFESLVCARLTVLGGAANGRLDWTCKHNIAETWEDYLRSK